MKWIALIALWAVSAGVGLYLARQETLGGLHFAMIAGWMALALGVAWLFARAGRALPDDRRE